ncbi:hypothetical protein C8Q73DRAFT_788117 [Cubamyces lactineus]|nr:hypothetical protein C8Q73DRAFT_788117 [Cubamyces lactineus]
MRQILTRLASVAHSSHSAHWPHIDVIVPDPPYIASPSPLCPSLSQRPLTTRTQSPSRSTLSIMGAIFSAIGAAINAVVSAIAEIIMIIVSVIVTIIVTIFDIIFDILCCNCFGGRQRRTGTHRYRFGRGGGAAATY